jgi:hypothetical protein
MEPQCLAAAYHAGALYVWGKEDASITPNIEFFRVLSLAPYGLGTGAEGVTGGTDAAGDGAGATGAGGEVDSAIFAGGQADGNSAGDASGIADSANNSASAAGSNATSAAAEGASAAPAANSGASDTSAGNGGAKAGLMLAKTSDPAARTTAALTLCALAALVLLTTRLRRHPGTIRP